ncbi:hypothetical protein HID58_006345 [Brassica napus]|uniref:AP180 N-terminal homology (ANTH) domain-containing protein n=1 Tax=Brassica napus TaxID=3708 RepID=A0ABQ8EB41_BRANA|nr:hypothetical protein HID58_006345 [Brassica napus]
MKDTDNLGEFYVRSTKPNHSLCFRKKNKETDEKRRCQTIKMSLSKLQRVIGAVKDQARVGLAKLGGDRAYEKEIFFTTRRGTRFFNLSDFKDANRSDSWDYSAFVRKYDVCLDERPDFRMERRGKHGVRKIDDLRETNTKTRSRALLVKSKPVTKMKIEKIFTRVQLLQKLLNRFLACHPTYHGSVDRSIPSKSMKSSVKNHIHINQYWCKKLGVSRSLEYLELEKVTRKKLDLMDGFIREKPALAAQTQRSSSKKSYKSKEEEEEETETEEINDKVVTKQDQEGDLLDEAGETVGTVAGNSLALALFDRAVKTETASEQPGWEAFDDDWRIERRVSLEEDLILFCLIECISTLRLNRLRLMEVVEMRIALHVHYRRRHQQRQNRKNKSVDPFTASLEVAPPPYMQVQMNDMENKQGLLMEEQIMGSIQHK